MHRLRNIHAFNIIRTNIRTVVTAFMEGRGEGVYSYIRVMAD